MVSQLTVNMTIAINWDIKPQTKQNMRFWYLSHTCLYVIVIKKDYRISLVKKGLILIVLLDVSV